MIKKGISTFAAGVRAAAPSLACAAGSVSLEKGAAVQLSSQVSLDGEYEVSTNWSVTGAESAGTSIDDNGFLTIGEDETASALTVVAAMTVTRTGSDGAETVETYSDSTTVIVTAPGAPDEEEEETGADPALIGGAKEDAAQPTNTPAPSESPRPAETNSSTSDTLLPEQKVEVPEAAAPQDGADGRHGRTRTLRRHPRCGPCDRRNPRHAIQENVRPLKALTFSRRREIAEDCGCLKTRTLMRRAAASL